MIDPGDPGADRSRRSTGLAQAQMLIEARRPHDALDLLGDLVRSDPTDAEVLAACGWAHLEAGDPVAAERWLVSALQHDWSDPWTHQLLAHALLKVGSRSWQALHHATCAAVAEPENVSSLHTLALAQLDGGDLDGAEATVHHIRRVDPGSHLGPAVGAYVEMHRAERSLFWRSAQWVPVFLTLIFRGLGLLIVLGGLGWHLYRRAPHLQRADALLQEAMALAPGDADVRAVAADVLRFPSGSGSRSSTAWLPRPSTPGRSMPMTW